MGNESQSKAGLARDSPPLNIDMTCGGKVEKHLTFNWVSKSHNFSHFGVKKNGTSWWKIYESHVLIIKFFHLFILNPFFCGGVGMIKHSDPYSRIAKPCSYYSSSPYDSAPMHCLHLALHQLFLGQDYQQI